jgi:hypothetical protein
MQVPEVPAELKEWAENTALGTAAGMLYCGGRQYLASRSEGESACLHVIPKAAPSLPFPVALRMHVKMLLIAPAGTNMLLS